VILCHLTLGSRPTHTQVWGIDIIESVRDLEGSFPPSVNSQIRTRVGSQTDAAFLRQLAAEAGGGFDIVLDDGSHVNSHMISTFETLYLDHVKAGGVYIVEDVHTSYMKSHGGELGLATTFMEYSKRLTDKLNAWHCEKLELDEFVNTTDSMHFYDSIVVVEKKQEVSSETWERGRETVREADFQRHTHTALGSRGWVPRSDGGTLGLSFFKPADHFCV
jgi:hypothetical protein